MGFPWRRRVGFGNQWRRVGKIDRVWRKGRWFHVILGRFVNRERRMIRVWLWGYRGIRPWQRLVIGLERWPGRWRMWIRVSV